MSCRSNPVRHQAHRVVVIGGGAGGIELVTRLGDCYRRQKHAAHVSVTLVDQSRFHIWKPLLHEVAAGALDANHAGLDYAVHAHRHGFQFCWGPLVGLDRPKRVVTVGPVDDAYGNPIHATRQLPYDTLVLAIGSTTNFFAVTGAEAHAFALDSIQDADRLRSALIALCARAERSGKGRDGARARIAIVGGGATGVELAAQMRDSLQALSDYRLHCLDAERDIAITVVEAGSRILPPLSEQVASSAATLLGKYGVAIRTHSQVRQVTERGLIFADGSSLQADLVVWAAGVKALPVLAQLDGLAIGEKGQIVVHDTLQAENDSNVFALGDCAQCRWHGTSNFVPPRAQAAHQQAAFLFKAIALRIKQGGNAGLARFRYRDFGSLVSLGKLGAAGNLMGRLVGGKLFIDGTIARLMFVSLHHMHVVALHGWLVTLADALSRLLRRPITPRIKLH